MSALGRRCLTIAAGLLVDRLTGEPPDSLHPVAWFGQAMQRAEATLWADSRAPGIAYAVVGVGLGAAAGQISRSTTVVVAVTVAGRQLRNTAEQIGLTVACGDLERAKTELVSLVGRDPTDLNASGIAAAVIESVAENSVDAVIAPVFWAVVIGGPGAAAYRAINTMDAMVGHRTARYGNFGWAAARIDDAANYLPARLFASLVAAQFPRRAVEILTTVRRYAPAHPSPNAGVAEASVAAAMGRELGGPLRYGPEVEERPTLGVGPRPVPQDIATAIRIADRAELAAIGILAFVWAIDVYRRVKTRD